MLVCAGTGTLVVTPIAQNAALMPNILITMLQANNFINASLIMDRTLESMSLVYLGVGTITARDAVPSAKGEIGDITHAFITPIAVIDCAKG